MSDKINDELKALFDSVHIGEVGAPLPDWRNDSDDDDDPDDEETEGPTDPFLIARLGFDPKDLPDDDGDAKSEEPVGKPSK